MDTEHMQNHILVAEDEADVRTFLVRALARIKPLARISDVRNGAEALQLFHAEGCNLIISDHRMPKMSGLDLLIAVRREANIPFIMLSADMEVSQQAVEAGVSLFLDKPIGLSMLRTAVMNMLPD